MNKTTTTRAAAGIAAASIALAASGDSYQFIISGDPVAAATENSHFDESAPTALDGVYRTNAESQATHLYTDKEGPTMLIFR